jgi:hypothetical protein
MGFLVENWMMGEGLHLKGCELLVFAYAYSYHRKGKSLFVSEGNLGKMIDYSRRYVGIAIDRLCEKQLLIRSEEKHPEYQTYTYSINEERVRSFFSPGCEESSQGDAKKVRTQVGRKVTPTCNLSSHNNRMDNLKDNQMFTETTTQFTNRFRHGTAINPALEVGDPEDFLES